MVNSGLEGRLIKAQTTVMADAMPERTQSASQTGRSEIVMSWMKDPSSCAWMAAKTSSEADDVSPNRFSDAQLLTTTPRVLPSVWKNDSIGAAWIVSSSVLAADWKAERR